MTLTANVIRSNFVGIDTGAIVSGVLPVARGGSGVSTSTGTGNVVLSNAPMLSNVTISGNGLFVSNGSNTSPSMTFSSNTSAGLYLDSNIVSSSTNLQTPSGIVMAMNTTTTVTGSMPAFIHALGCSLHTGSAPGISTGTVTPALASFVAADTLAYYKAGALYDFWRTYVNLAAGTYTFRLHTSYNYSNGIVSVVVGSTTVGTLDMYYATNVDTVSDITGIIVTTPGLYKVELQVNSKNASSAGYYFLWRAAAFIRTA